MQKKFIFAALAALSCFTNVFADDSADSFLSDFVSRNWTTADGLPANSVTSILQDKTGYIYFGTYDGLVRFDGVEFATLTRNSNPKYNFITVRTLFKDSNESIWVGSNDEGLVELRKDGRTRTYTSKDGIPNNSVRAICEDHEGNIWVGTAGGIAYIAGKDEEKPEVVVPEGLEEFAESNVLVMRLYCDTEGKIWIATGKENKLITYSANKFSLHGGFKSLENTTVTCVAQDNSGAFWFGVSPHYALKADGEEEEIFDIGHGKQRGTHVEKIYQDRSANIWCALDTGAAIIHDGKISYIDKSNGLCDNKLSDIMEDTEGNLWIATDSGGIDKLSQSKFRTVRLDSPVNALCHDKGRGVEWIACNDGLRCYKNGEFIENETTKLCRNTRIRHVGMTEDGELLISSYEKLGQVVVGKDGATRNFTKADGLESDKTRAAIKSRDGTYFVATTAGLNMIGADGTISSITKKDGIENEYIMCVFEDSLGRIWCGTDGGGVFTVEETGGIYKVADKLTTEDGLSGNIVFKVSEIGGNIWICTGSGMTRIKDGKLFNFNSSNGLGSTEVMQIIPDYTGTAWLTSNRGISSVKTEDLDACADGKIPRVSTRYFGKSDGLLSAGVTSTSCSDADPQGIIWFPLTDGFATYDPSEITSNEYAPIIHIQELTIDNEKREWDGKPVVLAPGVKRFGIKFTGVGFIASEQTQFSTELEGFDTEYTEWTHERSVSYTNLKHGTYRFSVIAKSGNDIISEPVEFSITKKPYIWELAWFYIAIGLFAIGTTIAVSMVRIKEIEKQKLTLKEEVDKKTEEIWGLLLNILPKETAEELRSNPKKTIAERHENVTVLFADIVGFAQMSEELPAEEGVKMLNTIFEKFDTRAKHEGIEKIKTVGDSYMAACGLRKEKDAAERMIRYARGIMHDLEELNEHSETKIAMRIGINTGSLVSGVVGSAKYIYDIWGDTVNIASRMESTGDSMRIHISESTFQATSGIFNYSGPQEVEVKGKGMMKTYYLEHL